MKKFLYFFFIINMLLQGCGLPGQNRKAEKPNFIIIYVDDMGYNDLGCYGATKVKTPNIDKMASQGRMFTDAHAVSAVCSPSRYALLTGQYPFRKDLFHHLN